MPPGRHALLAMILALAASAAAAAPAELDPATVAGVYKDRFVLRLAVDPPVNAENILEIVPTGPRAAYVRIHLELANGGICALHGIAHVDGPDLVYVSRPSALDSQVCKLRIEPRGSSIIFRDDQSCQADCGVNVGFEQADFQSASRRPIRYMGRLLSSWQYKDAMAEDGTKR